MGTVLDSRQEDVKFRQIRNVSLKEVSEHNTLNDCWIVLYDRVYNVTDFIPNHPGGSDIFLEYAGYDATIAFRGIGHDFNILQRLHQYCIGDLVMSERIFRTSNGIQFHTENTF